MNKNEFEESVTVELLDEFPKQNKKRASKKKVTSAKKTSGKAKKIAAPKTSKTSKKSVFPSADKTKSVQIIPSKMPDPKLEYYYDIDKEHGFHQEDSWPDDEPANSSKKGFWSRLFGL